jgi:hypothetical protein
MNELRYKYVNFLGLVVFMGRFPPDKEFSPSWEHPRWDNY